MIEIEKEDLEELFDGWISYLVVGWAEYDSYPCPDDIFFARKINQLLGDDPSFAKDIDQLAEHCEWHLGRKKT